jgi:hypothetical protein
VAALCGSAAQLLATVAFALVAAVGAAESPPAGASAYLAHIGTIAYAATRQSRQSARHCARSATNTRVRHGEKDKDKGAETKQHFALGCGRRPPALHRPEGSACSPRQCRTPARATLPALRFECIALLCAVRSLSQCCLPACLLRAALYTLHADVAWLHSHTAVHACRTARAACVHGAPARAASTRVAPQWPARSAAVHGGLAQLSHSRAVALPVDCFALALLCSALLCFALLCSALLCSAFAFAVAFAFAFALIRYAAQRIRRAPLDRLARRAQGIGCAYAP